MSRRAPPQSLPSYLSYKSALVLLPPASVQPPIEKLREQHDRNFDRWPPHINLIYPFLNQPSKSRQVITERVKNALRDIKPFCLQINSTSHFLHSKSSATVWLKPRDRDSDDQGAALCPTLLLLQAKLQEEFQECKADLRLFNPHLSIGQARGEKAAGALEAETEKTMACFVADGAVDQLLPWSLNWDVDRVCVIEREGFKDRFRVVEEVLLVGQDEVER